MDATPADESDVLDYYRKYKRSMLQRCRRMLPESEAEDAVQVVLYRLCVAAREGNLRQEGLGWYVTASLRNECLGRIHARKREMTDHFPEDWEPTAPASEVSEEDRKLLIELFNKMSEPQKMLVEMHFYHDFPISSISILVDRGRGKIRQMFDEIFMIARQLAA